jgi:hypothetical protein
MISFDADFKRADSQIPAHHSSKDLRPRHIIVSIYVNKTAQFMEPKTLGVSAPWDFSCESPERRSQYSALNDVPR